MPEQLEIKKNVDGKRNELGIMEFIKNQNEQHRLNAIDQFLPVFFCSFSIFNDPLCVVV